MNTVAGEAEMTCQHECSPFIAFPHGLQRHTYGICHCKLPTKAFPQEAVWLFAAPRARWTYDC